MSVLTRTKDRRSWKLVDVAKSFGLSSYDITDDPLTIYQTVKSLKLNLPAVLNIRTCREYWHEGAGKDKESKNFWNRYKIVRDQLSEIGQYPFLNKLEKKNEMGKKIMGKSVAETIRDLSKKIIDKNKAVVIGQCLSAVGWVQNTVPPQKKGIIELPMTDIAGAGFAVGVSLTGIRPIFILRFQSFLWLNASPLVNHAAKAKEMFGYGAPVFIRAIASEGPSSGPLILIVIIHHLHICRYAICAPMTQRIYLFGTNT